MCVPFVHPLKRVHFVHLLKILPVCTPLEARTYLYTFRNAYLILHLWKRVPVCILSEAHIFCTPSEEHIFCTPFEVRTCLNAFSWILIY